MHDPAETPAARDLSPRIRGIRTSQIGLVADRGRDDPEVVKGDEVVCP